MKKLVFVSIIVLLAAACGKYEDGPGLSLKSKEKRLCRDWQIDKLIENGEDITTQYKEMVTKHEIMFMDFGSVKETIGNTILAKAWEWGDKKETIIITYTLLGLTTETECTIRRLTSKEFWYTATIDEKEYEYHWAAK